MEKKIKFELQELASVVIDAIAAACLTVSGVPAAQASLIGASLGGVAKGFSVSDSGAANTILSTLERSVRAALDHGPFELPNDCKYLLETDALSPRRVIQFICQPDAKQVLRDQITAFCRQDADCDIDTLPADELAAEIIDQFETEVLNSHELAAYASYCILRKAAASADIYLANQGYADSFQEPLFLHKDAGLTQVNLTNLFIMQKYQLIKGNPFQSQPGTNGACGKAQDPPLDIFLAEFLHQDKVHFLFIEGDAGSGKTTLAAWMNYHYSLGDETAVQLFDGRPLVTIRLRDLDRKYISENNNLSAAIRKYMNLPSLDDLERLFPNAVMILDGFDELCMIEGVGFDHDRLLYELFQSELKGFQFLVTTRPKFISAGLDIPSVFISLRHFDRKQRTLWLDHYTSEKYCAQTIDNAVYDYIQNIEDDTASCICDTPMTLYMLAAKKGSAAFLENSWALYHHIFYEELSETEYNKMFPDPDRKYAHDISILRDVLYQVSEEIAYHMYQGTNQFFYLSARQLSAILGELSERIPILKHANMKDIAERCYALCCYWKANSNRGAVEFLHNNIRDFFLAEKICREMDEITGSIKDPREIDAVCEELTTKLCHLFQYGVLETKVSEFIFLRAKYNLENNRYDFAQCEYQNHLITNILSRMTAQGIIDSHVLSEASFLNPVQRMTNIVTCTVQLYRHAYEAHLKEGERIPWISESICNTPYRTVRTNILVSLFKPVFCQVPVTPSYDSMIAPGGRGCFDDADFKANDLRNINFQGSQIKNSDFSDAILIGCDLSYAILDGSNFTNADIHNASLEHASLIGCTMIGANLCGTRLPDGFVSLDQEEQIKHLKSLQISQLVI